MGLVQVQGIESPCVPRIATGLGAGMGRHGEVCGALSGAIMALGLKYGRDSGADTQAKERMYALVNRLFQAFQDEYGTITCLELTGCDLGTPEGMSQFTSEDMHHTLCPKFAVFAAEQALQLLEE